MVAAPTGRPRAWSASCSCLAGLAPWRRRRCPRPASRCERLDARATRLSSLADAVDTGSAGSARYTPVLTITRIAAAPSCARMSSTTRRWRSRSAPAPAGGRAPRARAELEVGGPEVVAPLARCSAPRRPRTAPMRCGRSASQRTGSAEPLRRDEHDPLVAVGDALQRARLLARRGSALLSCGDRDARLAQRVGLVLHQRDQRRDDERDARRRCSAGSW